MGFRWKGLAALPAVVMLGWVVLTAGCNSSNNRSSAPTATPTTVPTQSPTPTPSATATPLDQIIFSPAATNLPSTAGTISIQLNAFDSQGHPLTPSASNPINVSVYGSPSGAITPTSTTVTGGSNLMLAYDGGAVPNNVTINAWIKDSSISGYAIGQTQIATSGCTVGGTSVSVPLSSTVPNEMQFNAAVGYTDPTLAGSNLHTFTLDTGSLGTIVTASDLPSNSEVVGPAGQGTKCYDSSNNAYFGNYYLAPVDIQVSSGSGTTVAITSPVVVLAANKFCPVKNCTDNPLVINGACTTDPGIHYMGVGFARGGTVVGDLFGPPTANPFLHLTNVNGADIGTGINPGYVLSQAGVTLGIASTSGFNLLNLDPNTSYPGDWMSMTACYGFPNLPSPDQFCGTGLLDVGISQMYNDVPFAQRMAGTYDSNDEVPPNLTMNVTVGSSSSPIASYTYTTVQPPTAPTGAAPTFSQWIDTTSTGSIFV
ncbi:MAG: hypothetical protein ACYDC3_13790, partial [Candidatus Binataceae bacterium]